MPVIPVDITWYCPWGRSAYGFSWSLLEAFICLFLRLSSQFCFTKYN